MIATIHQLVTDQGSFASVYDTLLVRCSLQFAEHVDPWLDPSIPRGERVQDLLRRLTMEEKVSQLSTDSAGIPRLGITPMNWWAGQSL